MYCDWRKTKIETFQKGRVMNDIKNNCRILNFFKYGGVIVHFLFVRGLIPLVPTLNSAWADSASPVEVPADFELVPIPGDEPSAADLSYEVTQNFEVRAKPDSQPAEPVTRTEVSARCKLPPGDLEEQVVLLDPLRTFQLAELVPRSIYLQ